MNSKIWVRTLIFHRRRPGSELSSPFTSMGTTNFKLARNLLISLALFCLSAAAFQNPNTTSSAKAIKIRIPVGISESLWKKRIPADNPMSTTKVALGRALYFDKRLSVDGTVSCATCHDPSVAFTDSKAVAIGVGSLRGARNAPTVLNSVFSELLFWDGRAPSLEEQAKHPLMSPFEMGASTTKAFLERVSTITEYQKAFKQVFKSKNITLDAIAKAIAAYERTLLSGNSPFDRFITGDQGAITDSQRRGWELFKGKAKCNECHSYSLAQPFFSDFKFHNTGIAVSDTLFDKLLSVGPTQQTLLSTTAHSAEQSALGRFAVTLRTEDLGGFKTPTLRDVELTSPYMHDGSLKTLIDVVNFYNRGGNPNSHLDQRIQPLKLTDAEVNDLVEFMRALTSDDVLRQCQTAIPQTRTPVMK